MENTNSTIDAVIEHFGGATKTALTFNIRPSAVSNWRARGIPAHIAITVEKLTQGKFRAVDIYHPG